MPEGDVRLCPRDVLEVVGDDTSIGQLSARMSSEVVNNQYSKEKLNIRRLTLEFDSPYIGLTLQRSDIRNRMHCMVIGFEEEDGSLSIASADHVFQRGDTMWIVEEVN